MTDEARTTEVQEGGLCSTIYYLPLYCHSKNRHESRPSTTTLYIPCMCCTKCFAGALGHICQHPNAYQNCTRYWQLGHIYIAICNILSVCLLCAANLLVTPKTVYS